MNQASSSCIPPITSQEQLERLIAYDIAMTDDQIAEREEWIEYVASLDPEDETFENDLDYAESVEAF